jgi:Tfp pilus assembly protein FimT
MPSPCISRRDLLLRIVAAALLVAVVPALARSDDDTQKAAGTGKGGAAKPAGKTTAGDKTTKATNKKSEAAVLTVVVTGNGKPIAQAEVQVKFPPSIGGESKQSSNAAGEATFKSPALGTAKVRVIAAGWESDLKSVELKEGPQKLTVSLNPLSAAGQRADAKKKGANKPPADANGSADGKASANGKR